MATTILQALNDLNQHLTDNNLKIDELASRIAPDGESVQGTLSIGLLSNGQAYLSNLTELNYLSTLPDLHSATVDLGLIYKRCCELARNDSGANQPATTPYIGTDEQKCLNGRRLLGRTYEWLSWMKYAWPAVAIAGSVQFALVIEWLGAAGFLTFGLASNGALLLLAQAVVRAITNVGLVGALTFFWNLQSKYTSILPDLLCAFYNGCTAQEAYDNLVSVIQDQMSWESYEREIILYTITPTVVNAAFADSLGTDSTFAGKTSGTDGEELSEHVDDLGLDLDCSDCSGCGGGGGGNECGYATAWHVGTPALISNDNIVGGQVSSEWSSYGIQKIDFLSSDEITVTIQAMSLAPTKTLHLSVDTCLEGVESTTSHEFDYGDLPASVSGHRFHIVDQEWYSAEYPPFTVTYGVLS